MIHVASKYRLYISRKGLMLKQILLTPVLQCQNQGGSIFCINT